MSALVLRSAGLLGVSALVAVMANCASNDEATAPPTQADAAIPAMTVDDADTQDVNDASDAGCEGNTVDCPLVTSISCDDFEWCPEKTNHPQGLGLSSVWGSSANDVWVAGAFGSVLHWDGKAWAAVPAPTHASLRAIWGAGPGDIWVVSAPDQIFRSNGFVNGTAQWTSAVPVADMTGQTAVTTNAIWGSSPDKVWVGGAATYAQHANGRWYESGWQTTQIDGGPGWATGIDGSTFTTIRGIWGSGPDDVWIVGNKGQNGLPFGARIGGTNSVNGGPGVQEIDTQCLGALYGIWGSKAGDLWAVGDYGTIRHYTDESGQWIPVSSPTQENLRGVWGSSESDIWAVGEHATLIHWDGATWRTSSAAFAPGNRPSLTGVWGSGPNDVWAVGSGVVIHFTGPKANAQGATP
ncbi:WD40/YVTN/BNR-like repeat-containing protein [Labilithrix luteola]|nr:hypothetical protein [Labilithrix luteola]